MAASERGLFGTLVVELDPQNELNVAFAAELKSKGWSADSSVSNVFTKQFVHDVSNEEALKIAKADAQAAAVEAEFDVLTPCVFVTSHQSPESFSVSGV